MFTGIIEELAKVVSFQRIGGSFRLQIETEKVIDDMEIGESIAVNGVCLTVVKRVNNRLCFDVLNETASKTNLRMLKIGERVNIERALKMGMRISGHFINGHIDCLGIVRRKIYRGRDLCFEITFPSKFLKYVLEKGSIAVDGISLTIGQIRSNSFSVYVIPHTLGNTTLKFKGPSGSVNLEFDILTKVHSRQ